MTGTGGEGETEEEAEEEEAAAVEANFSAPFFFSFFAFPAAGAPPPSFCVGAGLLVDGWDMAKREIGVEVNERRSSDGDGDGRGREWMRLSVELFGLEYVLYRASVRCMNVRARIRYTLVG